MAVFSGCSPTMPLGRGDGWLSLQYHSGGKMDGYLDNATREGRWMAILTMPLGRGDIWLSAVTAGRQCHSERRWMAVFGDRQMSDMICI